MKSLMTLAPALFAAALYAVPVATMPDAVCTKTTLDREWTKAQKVELKRGQLYRLSATITTKDFACVNHVDLGGPEIHVAYLNAKGDSVGRGGSWCVVDTSPKGARVHALARLPENAVSAEIRLYVPAFVTGKIGFSDIALETYALPTPPEPTASPCPMIDGEGRLLVNGRKTFPLGMYFENWDPFTVSNLDVFADSPFNCVVPYGFPDKSQMDLCAARNIGVFYNANVYYGTRWAFGKVAGEAEEDAWMAKTVAAFKDHPALWGWYVNDEFFLNMLDRLNHRHALLKKLDPAHPTWGVFMRPANRLAPYFGGNMDVMGVDPYPVAAQGNKPAVDFSECATEPCAALDAFGRKRPVWGVIQDFDWKMYCPTAKNTRMTTEADLRAMTWQEIASGVNGVIYFSFTSLSYEGNGDTFAKNWASVRRVAAEVKAKEELLLSDPGVAFDRPPLPFVVRTWKHEGADVALVVNSAHTNAATHLVFDGCEPLDVTLGPLEHRFFTLKPKAGPLVRAFPDFESARKYVRALKKENGGKLPKGGVVAEIASGEINVSRPFTLTADDSGEPDAPVVYRARIPRAPSSHPLPK